MTEQAKVPAIRFAGFTDPWEQRKLGELSSEFQSGDFISAEKILASGPYPVYGGNGLRGYAKRYNHDGFYALIGRQGALCGNVNTAVGKAYFTEHAVAIKANSLHDTRFLVHLLRCMDLGQYSGQSAQPGLAVGVLKEVETTVPSKVEQQAIGSFFSRLDDLITLHQRKYDKLVIFKKSMLEKMFPKDGESVPEIRFAGFTDPWEQRKFVDFVEASGIRNKDNLQLESYSVSNDRGFVPQDEQFENGGTMRDADKTAYWIVEPGSFAYNPARINVGSIGYQSTRKNVIVSSLYEVFKTDRSCDDRFLWHWFKSSLFTKQIEMLQEGGVRLYFFFDKLQKSEIWMPNVDEQRIIGQQFDQLDSLITLHQRKLELLQNIKKSLLDKMFV
ncbi:restriction endonuclease [Bifidobacterium bifidum]|uniref:restriction endonuclease subunit S n=1 Tax=Bifidobacterium bifidum TaxID=1681 RepID=UPI0009BB12A9|nr:restriction endonuclease subunit S [Bifidobacterium bifidum]OQM66003.1 restriction endonuclease [Bifidobacterium bifidum]